MKKSAKKIVSLLLAAAFSMTALTFANFVSAEGFMLGDVNGNSKIDTLDSLKILKHVANIEKLTEAEQKAADCDENGTINSVDALKILKSIVGLESFKCFAQPASVFANNMVLQREEKVPVWGYAEDGRIVKVSFNGQEKQTVAKDGKWMIYLDPMEANKTPQNMTIMSTGTHVVKNILVGEVWFAGGQSNMAFQIGILGDPTLKNNIINDCAYPEIRVFTQNEVRSETPQKFNKGSKWTASSKATVSGFSVMGYLLARDLHKELNVPVGIITSAYGGTNIEDHINNKVLEESGLDVIYGGASTFKNNAYNAMLAPLFPFKVKGAIWYQGENNSAPEMAAKNYSSYLKLYVEQLRAGFENENMNFVQVQLPSFGSADFPDMRYYQMEGDDKIPNVYTVPAYDTGLEKDIHPSDKGPIAQRIKNTVLNKVYNKTQYTCVYPKADTFTQQDDNSLLVTFKQNVELEVVKEDANTLFVCDENGIYHQAKAQVVDGTKLKITTDKFTGKIYGVKYASEPMVKTAHIVTKNGKDLIMPFKWESLPEIPDVKKDIDMTYDFKTIADYNKYSTSYKFNYNDGFTGYPSVDNPTHQIGPVVENGGFNDSKALSLTLKKDIPASYFVLNTKAGLGDNRGSKRATEMWFWLDTGSAKIDSLYLGARCGGLYGTQYSTASKKGVTGRIVYLVRDGSTEVEEIELSENGTIDNLENFKGFIRVPTKYLLDETASNNRIDSAKIDTFLFGLKVGNDQNDKIIKIDNVLIYGPALQDATGKTADLFN